MSAKHGSVLRSAEPSEIEKFVRTSMHAEKYFSRDTFLIGVRSLYHTSEGAELSRDKNERINSLFIFLTPFRL